MFVARFWTSYERTMNFGILDNGHVSNAPLLAVVRQILPRENIDL